MFYLSDILFVLHFDFSHEVADVAGLTSFSFGIEEQDRYVMVWKKVRYIQQAQITYNSLVVVGTLILKPKKCIIKKSKSCLLVSFEIFGPHILSVM